jgi:hypothetical protein
VRSCRKIGRCGDRVLRGKINIQKQKTDLALKDFRIADSIELGKTLMSARASICLFVTFFPDEFSPNFEFDSESLVVFNRFLTRLDADSKLEHESKLLGLFQIVLFTIEHNEKSFEQVTPLVRRICLELALLGWLNQFGSALVTDLRTWKPKSYKGEKLKRRAWFKLWQTIAETHVELEIPVRIMRVAFAFFDSGDERELLNLPLEERELLRKALAEPEAKPAPKRTRKITKMPND